MPPRLLTRYIRRGQQPLYSSTGTVAAVACEKFQPAARCVYAGLREAEHATTQKPLAAREKHEEIISLPKSQGPNTVFEELQVSMGPAADLHKPDASASRRPRLWG
jgi:hypothetical protein